MDGFAITVSPRTTDNAVAIPFCRKRGTGTRERNKQPEKQGVASRGQDCKTEPPARKGTRVPLPADLRLRKTTRAAPCYRARQAQRPAEIATATTSGEQFHSRRRFQRLKSHAGGVRGNGQSRLSGSSPSSSSPTEASNAKNTSKKAVSR